MDSVVLKEGMELFWELNFFAVGFSSFVECLRVVVDGI